jgi:AraC family transcriptional regulator, positive regulator of tynA and feaB
MEQPDDLLGAPVLNYEQWMSDLVPLIGHHTPDDPKTFAGRVRFRDVCGFEAAGINVNARRAERTRRDIRLDEIDCFTAVFQTAGSGTVIQDDQAVTLAAGDVALVDMARPATNLMEQNGWNGLTLALPRQQLVSHFGFEPKGGLRGLNNAGVKRALFQLVQDKDGASMSGPARDFMRLAVYDLLGALFAPSDVPTASAYNEKLFRRVCDYINDSFTDPKLSPWRVAAEARISLRYLQQLFTARGLTCTGYLQSARLDHAARLLRQRAALKTNRPLAEIAYASGYNDYRNFLRQFRRRFGQPPSDFEG